MRRTSALRWPRIAAAALLAALFVGDARLPADTFSVGTGVSCTHSSVVSAVAAAAATAGSDTIRIVNPVTMSAPAILINESAVTFTGTTSCTSSTPQLRSISLGDGDFQFTGTWVEMYNLDIVGTGFRRIMTLNGAIVTLHATSLSNGWSTFGGNVHLSAGASIVLQNGSRIHDGHATTGFGGGVYCTGGGTIGVQSGSSIDHNVAGVAGGGAYLDGCNLNVSTGGVILAAAALGSTGGAGDASTEDDLSVDGAGGGDFYYGIAHNETQGESNGDSVGGGGGVFAENGSSIVLDKGWLVYNESKDSNGGGLHLRGNDTTAVLIDSRVARNFALGINDTHGGGFYLTDQASLTMHRSALQCGDGYRCSLLDTNQALLGDNLGGTLFVEGGAEARIRQTFLNGGLAGDRGGVGFVRGAGSKLFFEGVMLWQNGGAPLVVAESGGLADLRFVTAAGNALGGGAGGLLYPDTNGTTNLLSSVVVESLGEYVFGGPPAVGADGFMDCLLTHDASLSGSTVYHQTDVNVVFAGAASGDLRLRGGSPAIDHCDDFYAVPTDTDIEVQVRDVDNPSSPNSYGFYDLGADEYHPIFVDGFQSGNTNAWSAKVP
jgi:hypothetical protein